MPSRAPQRIKWYRGSQRLLVGREHTKRAFLQSVWGSIGDTVTVHHLLTHTSGMGSYRNAAFEATRSSLRSVWDYVPLFRDDPLAFEPGERFGYSNAGYIVLGAIIEQVSGKSYDDYVHEHVYTRAGMVNSGPWALDEDVPNRAIGYVRSGEDTLMDPVQVTQAFIDAFNARDVDRVVDCFHADAAMASEPGTVFVQGEEAIRAHFGSFLPQSPTVHAEILSRIHVGSWVVHEEHVTGRVIGEPVPEFYIPCAYRVEDGKIVKSIGLQ